MEKNPQRVTDLLDCDTTNEAMELIKNTHPAVLGGLINLITTEVPKGNNAQALAHPDLRNPLKELVEKGNEQLKDMRENIDNYLAGDPFLDEEK